MHPNAKPTPAQPKAPATPKPRILLAEDDAASRQFIATALTALGYAVSICANGSSALENACAQAFDLLLLDRNIPAPSGESVLRQLRANRQAASHASPAVATSADWTSARRHQAHGAGFVATLDKPCSIDQLRQVLRAHLPVTHQPLRDDGTALRHAGSATNLRALRKLFARELAQFEQRLPSLLQQPQALDAQLHRLIASTGFCGAPALAAASTRWLQQLRDGGDPHEGAAAFRSTLQATARRFETLLRE